MENKFIFVVKDLNGNFAQCINYDQKTEMVTYSSSPFLTNGPWTYSTEQQAIKKANELRKLSKLYNLDIRFYVDKLDPIKHLQFENSLGNISKYPFVHETFERTMLWVIRDDRGNFADRNSIFKSQASTWLYVSHKTFSPECRAYKTKRQALKVLSQLNDKKCNLGIDTEFSLDYVDIDKLIEEHKAFDGDSITIVRCEVA
ncbi:hypothetical protein [Desulfosporosinus sp. FKA]|uniref:hypothetical protein n=1 Tax=Desulfosporosinus sp. FKA TaxID=1969834 RepID=UPI000B4A072D|nr:hypothetical protein [Desulfosporosinus sp. FKA]